MILFKYENFYKLNKIQNNKIKKYKLIGALFFSVKNILFNKNHNYTLWIIILNLKINKIDINILFIVKKYMLFLNINKIDNIYKLQVIITFKAKVHILIIVYSHLLILIVYYIL